MNTYIKEMSEDLRWAAYRVGIRETGAICSDVWADGPAGEERDYRLVAAEWKRLHPDCGWDDWDAAAAWNREFGRALLAHGF